MSTNKHSGHPVSSLHRVGIDGSIFAPDVVPNSSISGSNLTLTGHGSTGFSTVADAGVTTVDFTGGSERLVVTSALGDTTYTVNGFHYVDQIELQGYGQVTETFVPGVGLEITKGGQTATIDFTTPGLVSSNFTITYQGGNTFIEICYLRGTHILTPTGEVKIEDIKIGDSVVTRFGGLQAVKWVGRQSFDGRFLANDAEKIPVTISAGALGPNQPVRDLSVSPAHSMLINGQLVLAKNLVNGITIRQDNVPDRVDYFQIELDGHDCVIAEGTFSETFADGPGLRAMFHNAAEFAALYPEHFPAEELVLCAPRHLTGEKMYAAIAPIVATAAAKVAPGPLAGFIDQVSGNRKISGWAQDLANPNLPVELEIVIDDKVVGTVLAADHREDLASAGRGRGYAAFTFTSSVFLRPSMLATLKVRRAADGAELAMTEDCRAILGDAAPAAEMPRLRLVG
jgi:hypothetical protein